MFSGDSSGAWIYRALYETGFADRPAPAGPGGGLQLHAAWITAVARCAPPDNEPLREELTNCRPYLAREIERLESVRVVLVLGRIAYENFLPAYESVSGFALRPKPRFKHGGVVRPKESVKLLMSYHPSRQNTQTGRLSPRMWRAVFRKAADLLAP